jgi:hypothetical protein
MRVVKAAAVQLSPVLYSREGTVEKVVGKIHELGGQGYSSPPSQRPWFHTTRTFHSFSHLYRTLQDLSRVSCSRRPSRCPPVPRTPSAKLLSRHESL